MTNSYDGFGQHTSETTNMDGTSRTLRLSSYDADGNRTALTGRRRLLGRLRL